MLFFGCLLLLAFLFVGALLMAAAIIAEPLSAVVFAAAVFGFAVLRRTRRGRRISHGSLVRSARR